MKELKTESTYKGTRILVGNEKRAMLNSMIAILVEKGFTEISMPILQLQETFAGKVGAENNNLMFNFKDRGNRDVCLAPEYTAVVQQLAMKQYKQNKEVKLFYVQECFRGEKPQAGRYRQFTQLGVEILNPYKETLIENLGELAEELISELNLKYEINYNVTRGLDYYKDGKGFEIACEDLGSSKQICGGGTYEGGMGFALGIDRILKIQP
jgi:histidyl-tRNA synthetase